ncbi:MULTISPECIES: DUF2304 domain-containing protein [unclassified Saccharothrix]|uniref:DUF2304 domain-containing protein n=1 Tax=unclassified Saccharothrix TaxID=2593673 RepID=UPI00307E2675
MIELVGAGAFGFVLGWNLYFVNRYRTDKVSLSQLTSLMGIVGGAAVLALFPAGTALFGAYGIGLAAGFLAYLGVLLLMVWKSPSFSVAWLLDGRRPALEDGEERPGDGRGGGTPMGDPEHRLPS